MLLEILFYLFIFISTINVVHFGFYLVGANYYDVLQIKQKRSRAKLRLRHQPLVSVLIPAHNEELAIVRCLESVRASSYRNLEIFVIDDASKDDTRKLVRTFINTYPDRNIKLIWKRKNVGKGSALNYALKNHVRGDIVMTLDADSVLHQDSIANAVEYYQDPRIVGVAANVRVMDSTTILGLLQKFEYMIGYRSKKFFTITNSEFIIGGVASTYRYETMKQVGFYDDDILTEDIALSLKVISNGNRDQRIVYGVNVLAMTEGVQTFKVLLKQRYRWKLGNMQCLFKYRHMFASRNKSFSRMLTWYRIPMAFLGEIILLLEPFALAYVVYICYQAGSLSMVIGAYITLTLYMLWSVWPDEHMPLRKKLQMTAYSPAMYFIMYIMNIVQLAAIFKVMRNFKQIKGQKGRKSTWVSPPRAGKTQVQFS